MTSRRTIGFPRLRWFLPVLAFMALPLLSCTDAGDSPSGPVDDTQLVNEGKAGLTAGAGDAEPGGTIGINGYFNDANGSPVGGVQIVCSSEKVGYFTFVTNPTLTSASGNFSVEARVSSDTPPGSYTLVAMTSPAYKGPHTIARMSIHILSSGLEVISTPDAPIGNTFPDSGQITPYRAQGSVSDLKHEIEYLFDWGDGASSTWVTADSSGEAIADHAFLFGCGDTINLVTVKARCKAHPTIVSKTSPPLTIKMTIICP